MARQLIVVSRDDVGLYQAFRADWVDDDNVSVILDRRHAERRRQTLPTLERRRADRRQRAPVEAHFAWRGGGATARKAEIASALGHGAGSIAVRQRPGAKAAGRPLPRPQSEPTHEAIPLRAALSAPMSVAVALVALVATLSGGIVSGLAVWLFLANEFSPAAPHAKPAARSVPRSELISRWPQPLKKLLRGYLA
jgi:hypothetical protein